MTVIICADDFGMHPAIDDGIITLLKNNKISAVSCMSNALYWKQNGASLLPFLNTAKIGLHFNMPYQSLGFFILKSHLRLLNKEKIKAALVEQYHNFINIIGRKPDFIDGHQHIHQLPLIRDIVIDFYKIHYPTYSGFIRNTQNTQKNVKAKIINWLGAKTLKKLLEKNNIPHNKNFSGIYDLSEKRNYLELFKHFLNDIDNDGLIMCHPASDNPKHHELFRVNEFRSLLFAQR